jgi:hypothetical protein
MPLEFDKDAWGKANNKLHARVEAKIKRLNTRRRILSYILPSYRVPDFKTGETVYCRNCGQKTKHPTRVNMIPFCRHCMHHLVSSAQNRKTSTLGRILRKKDK